MGLFFAFLRRERECVQVLRYFWDKWIPRRVAEVRLNTQTATGKCVEEFEGTSPSFWQLCSFQQEAGVAGAGDPKLSWIGEFWFLLQRGNLPWLCSLQDCLGKISSFLFHFSPCWSSVWNPLLVFSFQRVKMELSPFQTPSSPHYT